MRMLQFTFFLSIANPSPGDLTRPPIFGEGFAGLGSVLTCSGPNIFVLWLQSLWNPSFLSSGPLCVPFAFVPPFFFSSFSPEWLLCVEGFPDEPLGGPFEGLPVGPPDGPLGGCPDGPAIFSTSARERFGACSNHLCQREEVSRVCLCPTTTKPILALVRRTFSLQGSSE